MCIRIIIIDESVTNTMEYTCFSICDPLSPDNNVLGTGDFSSDQNVGDYNSCCDVFGISSGYGTNTETCSFNLCKFYCIYYNYVSCIQIYSYYF